MMPGIILDSGWLFHFVKAFESHTEYKSSEHWAGTKSISKTDKNFGSLTCRVITLILFYFIFFNFQGTVKLSK